MKAPTGERFHWGREHSLRNDLKKKGKKLMPAVELAEIDTPEP